MAEVPSTRVLPLDSSAPSFSLPDPRGGDFDLDSLRGPQGLVVMFVCNHCPFVVHLAKELGRFGDECREQGIGVVAISSNNVDKYPADAPEKMGPFATESGWNFPYLYDASQQVAKDYVAACTPDFYLFDGDLKLTYCGQFDASRPGNGKPVDGADLRAAVQAVLQGAPPLDPQRPSSGCNIKWIPGQEPDHFSLPGR